MGKREFGSLPDFSAETISGVGEGEHVATSTLLAHC